MKGIPLVGERAVFHPAAHEEQPIHLPLFRRVFTSARGLSFYTFSERRLVERLFPVGSKRRDAFDRRGSILVGDVHPEVEEVAGALTPVPGGVGPLTIAMLMANTVKAAEIRSR